MNAMQQKCLRSIFFALLALQVSQELFAQNIKPAPSTLTEFEFKPCEEITTKSFANRIKFLKEEIQDYGPTGKKRRYHASSVSDARLLGAQKELDEISGLSALQYASRNPPYNPLYDLEGTYMGIESSKKVIAALESGSEERMIRIIGVPYSGQELEQRLTDDRSFLCMLGVRLEQLKRKPGSKPAAVQSKYLPPANRADPPQVSGESPQQKIASCSEDIRRTQLESQSWPGNANDVAARLGRFQKELFKGRCASHPEAQAYIAGANKMLGYGGNSAANEGGSQTPLPSAGNQGSGGSTDPSRTRKVHNPAADARNCVQLIQDSQRQGAGTSGNWRFVNNCDSTVELFWCFVQDNGSCREGGTWTVHAGKGWPTFGNKPIKWGACRGRDGGGMDRDSEGNRYTCHLLHW